MTNHVDEGREPVGEVFLSAEDGKPVPKLYGRYANLPDGTELYTSPPPNSDEARYAERYRYLRSEKRREALHLTGPDAGVWCDTEDENGTLFLLTEKDLDAAIDAALAAQQKG